MTTQYPRVIALAGFIALALAPRVATGQEPVVVQGRVIDASSRAPLAGVSVGLTGYPSVLTDESGAFRFAEVSPGRYAVSLERIGYVANDTIITLAADIDLSLEMAVAPVALDTVQVSVGQVRVKGQVFERESGTWVIDGVVAATTGLQTETDRLGRFDIGRVPSGVPLTIRVQSFAFLPATVTFTPQQDTTLKIELEPDPVMARMIDQQMERLDERLEDRRYRSLPTLERADMLKGINGRVRDVLRFELGRAMFNRIICVIVDEDEFATRWRYADLDPDEVQRIEILNVPGPARSLLVRIYTREFVRQMVEGTAELVDRELAMRRVAGRCR